MDATQMIDDSIFESEDEGTEEENEYSGKPMAKLRVLKNEHVPETELPLYLGENVLGRDNNTCTLPLPASSVSKQHIAISISTLRERDPKDKVAIEALVWDLGSMNGTRRGRFKLTPHVRYALSEGDSLVVADIPCQYVSCDLDERSGKEDLRPSVNGKSQTPEKTNKTPSGSNGLSFEQTPSQPKGTLVPVSDSDSDGEQGGKRDGWRKLVSESHLSSPTCSTFLSPTDKIIPESEDESPITPSSFTENRPKKHVGFREEETDRKAGRRQPQSTGPQMVVVDDGGEEIGCRRDEERAASPGGAAKQADKVDLSGEAGSPVPTPTGSADFKPKFNMDSDSDSDTDMEAGDDPPKAAHPVTLNASAASDHTTGHVPFHMDSDTDVEGDHDGSDVGPKAAPPPDNNSSTHSETPLIAKTTGISLDSDTFVEDAAKIPAAYANTATSSQTSGFHLDSDTDVEEQEGSTTGSKTGEAPSTTDPDGAQSSSSAPADFHLDSDTDDELTPAPAGSSSTEVTAQVVSATIADAEAGLEVLSDSDTDLEEEVPLLSPVITAEISAPPSSGDGDLNAPDTDGGETSVPPAALMRNSDTNVEEEEAGAGQDRTLHKCSTPLGVPAIVEEMETQSFLSPFSDSFKSPSAPAIRPAMLSSCSDSQEEEDFVVAETQSFVLETRDYKCSVAEDATQAFCIDPSQDEGSSRAASFQLGLSNRSHPKPQPQANAMDNTQAFTSIDRDMNQEATQCYATIPLETSSADDDSDLDTTQPYEGSSGHGGRSAVFKAERQGDVYLEETQAYIPESHSDTEGQEQRSDFATAETQPMDLPISPTLSTAGTQLLPAFTDDDELPREREEVLSSHYLSTAETQPVATGDDGDNKEVIPAPRKRRAKRLRALEDEETQRLASSQLSMAETQPMLALDDNDGGNGTATESDKDDASRKRLPRRGKGRLSEAGTSSVSSRGRRTRGALVAEEEQVEALTLPPKRQTRGNGKARGKVGPEEEETDEEEMEVGRVKRGRGRKTTQELDKQEEREKAMETLEKKRRQALERERKKERERVEKERKEKEEQELLEKERNKEVKRLAHEKERLKREKERIEQERKEKERLEREKAEREETERLEKEQIERERKEKEEQEKLEMERIEKERVAREKERVERQERERLQMERQKKEEQERLERKRKEEEERERLERQKAEREEKERLEREEKEQIEREEKEQIERERREKEEQERLERKRKEEEERERLEHQKAEREEKERLEREEKERIERERREKEEQERLERKREEERARLECQKAEREEKDRLEREEKERIERERQEKLERKRKEEEEKERILREQTERQEKEMLERMEKERIEQDRMDREKQKEAAKKKEQEARAEERQAPKTSSRGRKSTRRTTAALPPAEPDPASNTADNDFPACRTRSRSNSFNSVSSGRSSISSIGTQEGKSCGAKRTSQQAFEIPTSATNSRRTVAVSAPSPVTLSRSNSSNSINSDISSYSVASQNRGRGGRGRGGRGRKTAPVSETGLVCSLDSSQDHQSSAPKAAARGRKSRRVEGPTDREDNIETQQPITTRGRRRVNANDSEHTAVVEEDKTSQNQESTSRDSLLPKSRGRGRGQKAKCVTAGDKVLQSSGGRGVKRELEEEEQEEEEKETNGTKTPQARAKTQPGRRTEDLKMELAEEKEEKPVPSVPASRRGRELTAQRRKNTKEPFPDQEVQNSLDQDISSQSSEPQTPTLSRKRAAPLNRSPVVKTPRASSGSPGAAGRLRDATQAYMVLFTGVTDDAGERVVARLGGSLANSMADMTYLVTDKVRRTVKFLCAVARGIPIVTPQWLEKCGKAGSFLPPNAFIIKDTEQEKKFDFCLQKSLSVASSQPLLQGYNIHVTKSVKPEPVQMKDIISCSGGSFLPKMPSSHKAQTLVVSCEEDWALCGPALSASLPVVNAEFILTGILQQKIDLITHTLPAPNAVPQPAGGKGRARKKI